MPIQSFSDNATEEFFITGQARKGVGWKQLSKVVKRKLDMVDYAQELRDLASPPGNRLEALKGRLKGFHSIRVSERWRIVFRWTNAGPAEVRVEDYH